MCLVVAVAHRRVGQGVATVRTHREDLPLLTGSGESRKASRTNTPMLRGARISAHGLIVSGNSQPVVGMIQISPRDLDIARLVFSTAKTDTAHAFKRRHPAVLARGISVTGHSVWFMRLDLRRVSALQITWYQIVNTKYNSLV